LAPPGQWVGKRQRRLVRQRPLDRLDRFGETCQNPRIQTIGLGPLAGRLGEVTHLAGIDHRHRQSRGQQLRHQGPLQTAGRFQHDQSRTRLLERLHQRRYPAVIIGEGGVLVSSGHMYIQPRLRDVHSDPAFRALRHSHRSCYPALQNRASRPGNCSGCKEKIRTDPSSPTISQSKG
jgi:hypothetical protein